MKQLYFLILALNGFFIPLTVYSMRDKDKKLMNAVRHFTKKSDKRCAFYPGVNKYDLLKKKRGCPQCELAYNKLKTNIYFFSLCNEDQRFLKAHIATQGHAQNLINNTPSYASEGTIELLKNSISIFYANALLEKNKLDAKRLVQRYATEKEKKFLDDRATEQVNFQFNIIKYTMQIIRCNHHSCSSSSTKNVTPLKNPEVRRTLTFD